MKWTIYCHMHIETRRCYVGLTSQSMEHRWKTHVSKARSSRGGRWHFPNAIRKYGKGAFSHRILEICDSLEKANLREEAWIELFETRDPEFGFNLTKGGGSQPHPIRKNPWDDPVYRKNASEAARARASTPAGKNLMRANGLKSLGRKHKPETIAKLSTPLKTKEEHLAVRELCESQHSKFGSKEHRAKISAAIRLIASDPEHRKKISMGVKSSAYILSLSSATYCRRGHEFSLENTIIQPGGRKCRKCKSITRRLRRQSGASH
jgi:group I intron endonuclease